MPFGLSVFVLFVLFGLVSYLLGSISFAVIFTRKFAHTDVRSHGSGNAGMTNVMRTAGMAPGLLTLAFDVLKAAVAVFLGYYVLTWLVVQISPDPARYAAGLDPVYGATVCGLCCVIGHIYPIFFGFKGGKGVLVSLGMICVLDWRCALILLGVFLIVLLLSRMVSAASIAAAISYPIVTYLLYAFFTPAPQAESITLFGLPLLWFRTLAAALFGIIVIIKHKDNIVRICKGEEKKFFIKKKHS